MQDVCQASCMIVGRVGMLRRFQFSPSIYPIILYPHTAVDMDTVNDNKAVENMILYDEVLTSEVPTTRFLPLFY